MGIISRRLIAFWSSLQLTVCLLIAMGVLVFFMTLAQVETGIYVANQRYFGQAFIWWQSPWGDIPVFLGGGVLGGLLVVNLLVAHITRFKWTKAKIGLWLTHVGLLTLLIGSGLSAIQTIESQMVIQEGQTVSYSEQLRTTELAIETPLSPTQNRQWSIPEALLKPGHVLRPPQVPFELTVTHWYQNTRLEMNATVGQGLPKATHGLGQHITVFPMPPILRDDFRNQSAVLVSLTQGKQLLGTWLLSTGLGAPQSIVVNGVTYSLSLRPQRVYHPYRIRLDEFSHSYYTDTNTPKHFASAVTVMEPDGHTHRATISMNHPLRMGGNAHFQASFGQDGKSTVLQVVSNPGWWVPYVSTAIMTVGLLIHFGLSLMRYRRQHP
ncbi:hypothetical protein EBZ35_02845 [bacterium]|nr:hypothetical protein [bacterium]